MNTNNQATKDHLKNRLWAELGLSNLILMETTIFNAWYQPLVKPQSTWLKSGIFISLFLIFTILCFRLIRKLRFSKWIKSMFALGWFFFSLTVISRYIMFGETRPITTSHIINGIIHTITDNDSSGIEGFWHLFILVIVFWRANRLSIDIPGPFGTIQSYQLFIVLLIPYTVLFAKLYSLESIFSAFAFFFFGLISLSLSRLSYLSELRGGKLPQLSIDRFLGIIISALLATSIAFGLAYLISNFVAEVIIQILGSILLFIAAILTLIMIPVISFLITSLVKLLPASRPIEITQIPTYADMLKQLIGEDTRISNTLVFIQRYGGLITLSGIILVLIIITLLGFNWYTKRRNYLYENETSISQSRSILSLLPDSLKPWGRSKKKSVTFRKLVAAARIQQIYRRLVSLAARLGVPRHPAITPLEYLPQLNILFPTCQSEVASITHSFVKIRYGELPETDEEVTQIIEAWKSIEKTGKITLREKKMGQDNNVNTASGNEH